MDVPVGAFEGRRFTKHCGNERHGEANLRYTADTEPLFTVVLPIVSLPNTAEAPEIEVNIVLEAMM